MDITISNPSPVRGSVGDPKVTNAEEALNLSGGSTDSLKENQSENNRSRQSQQNDSALSKSSSQQALVAPNDSSLTAVPLQSHQPTTCNDSAFHHSDSEDDESFADCPTFHSPAVNKLLLLKSSSLRQSLGMDTLTNNLGGFTLDSSIGANSTVNVMGGNVDVDVKEIEEQLETIRTEVSQHLAGVEQEDVTQEAAKVDVIQEIAKVDLTQDVVDLTVERTHVEDHQSENSPEVTQVILQSNSPKDVITVEVPEEAQEQPLPSPPPPLEGATDFQHEFTCDDVEMMSVVMENGIPGDEDYSEIPLPEDAAEELHEDQIRAEIQKLQAAVQEQLSSTVVQETTALADRSLPVTDYVEIANVTCDMEVDVTESPEKIAAIPVEEKQKTPVPDNISVSSGAVEPEVTVQEVQKTEEFKMPTLMRRSLTNQPQAVVANPFDGSPTGVPEVKQELFFSSKDFDFLQNKETSNSLSTAIKDSVLLRFDPLINQPVIVESRTAEELPAFVAPPKNQSQSIPAASDNSVVSQKRSQRFSSRSSLEARIPEEGEFDREDSLLEVFGVSRTQPVSACRGVASESDKGPASRAQGSSCPISQLVDVTMSLVDVNNDSNLSVVGGEKDLSLIGGVGDGGHNNKTNNNISNISSSTNLEDFECSKLRMSVDGSQQQQHNQTNGETKIRNERYEDMERKMKEMEEREETLLKRLTEKEKQITKMGHIVEEYERSIAGFMKERAKTREEYHKRCLELEAERNANYQHLSSLETTFSDLHVKYERSKQQMEALKKSEELLLADKQQAMEQAAAQEERYDKLKKHAMQQMEIANNRLREDFQASQSEISRLKALLKKEEITRCSLQEQLNQKTKEIEELMKIWDELKSDQ